MVVNAKKIRPIVTIYTPIPSKPWPNANLVSAAPECSLVQAPVSTKFAFGQGLEGIGVYIVTIGLIFFAFTTIIGWNYYGERCTVYLFGVKGIIPYKIIYIALIAIGPFLKLEMIWIIADIVNGLMAIPNLIAIIGLRQVIISETRGFFKEMEIQKA